MKDSLIFFKSDKKNNFFAPEWSYYIYENIIDDIDFSSLSSFILSKEVFILNKYNVTDKNNNVDGYTGLGKKSVTSRYSQYNFLNFSCEEIEKIKKNIILNYKNFLNKLNLSIPDELYVQCWVNIMRKGEKIMPHIHGLSPDTYLGGHICIQCQETKTYYVNPINQINDPLTHESVNQVGKITLFQNFIPHYTDVHNFEKPRITMAFDLLINKNVISNNFIKLI
jgi:hypothetical protein